MKFGPWIFACIFAIIMNTIDREFSVDLMDAMTSIIILYLFLISWDKEDV